jgi:hypothetical protein
MGPFSPTAPLLHGMDLLCLVFGESHQLARSLAHSSNSTRILQTKSFYGSRPTVESSLQEKIHERKGKWHFTVAQIYIVLLLIGHYSLFLIMKLMISFRFIFCIDLLILVVFFLYLFFFPIIILVLVFCARDPECAWWRWGACIVVGEATSSK